MNTNVEFWDNLYKDKYNDIPEYDLWLDKYKELLKISKNCNIVDLGCGSGGNEIYLNNNGYKVLACDYSEEALKLVRKYVPEVETMKLDFTEKLPFQPRSIKIIIADLSLHYFNDVQTRKLINEIYRVIDQDGYLLCRVNSIYDKNYGAFEGKEVENHYFFTTNGFKRFFDFSDIRKYFSVFTIKECKEVETSKYGLTKKMWEIVLHKSK